MRKSKRRTGLITVKPGHKVDLGDIDTGATGDYRAKEEAQERLCELESRLCTLQERLFAEHKQSLLIVLQSLDTGGKDGTVSHIMRGVNPAGVEVANFKAPNDVELSHDFLWRSHRKAPAKGLIGVWNRSHYEDVLIVRVHDLVPAKVWKRRYDDINAFEKMLDNNGVRILKFFLYISRDEQKKRLQERLEDPDKHWKFSANDLKERAFWGKYMDAYEEALEKCSTSYAPWHIVPADHKWSRNLAVAEKVVAALEDMDPKYPQVNFDPSSISID